MQIKFVGIDDFYQIIKKILYLCNVKQKTIENYE